MNRVCFKKSILKAIEELNEIIILGSIIQIIEILGNDILKDVQRILLQSDFLLTIGLNQKKKKHRRIRISCGESKQSFWVRHH